MVLPLTLAPDELATVRLDLNTSVALQGLSQRLGLG